jgi:carbamoyltransferase
MKSEIAQTFLNEFGAEPKQILFNQHHRSHAASAFFPSPFKESAVLCLDGVGEWATTTAWVGKDKQLDQLWEIKFPHSLGLLYSAFTYYTGFKVNSGEYKLMGLAPYGKPQYKQLILDKLIDLKEDGSFRLNMKYFNYCTGLTMTNKKFDTLFGGKSPRHPQDPVTSREMNLASSIQAVTEEIIMRLAKTIYKNTGAKNLCLAGGVALNCVANGKLLQDGPFDNIWIQPAAGDAGGALGAALDLWFRHNESIRKPHQNMMNGCYLGPAFSNEQIENFLKKYSNKLIMPRLKKALAIMHFTDSDNS